MDELNRSVAKRQIARLLGGSSNPTYVLSEDDTLVFANDALVAYVGRSTESLLGLVCSSPIPDDGLPDSRLIAFLSIPATWSRKYLKIVPFVNPFVDSSDTMFIESRPKAKRLPDVGWVRCLIPLSDTRAGCTLCVLCQMQDSERTSQFDEHASAIQQILMESRARYAHLNELWFLEFQFVFLRG